MTKTVDSSSALKVRDSTGTAYCCGNRQTGCCNTSAHQSDVWITVTWLQWHAFSLRVRVLANHRWRPCMWKSHTSPAGISTLKPAVVFIQCYIANLLLKTLFRFSVFCFKRIERLSLVCGVCWQRVCGNAFS